MGLFKTQRNKQHADWDDAYVANAHFYEGPGVNPFGAFSLTEDTTTVLPVTPLYKVDDSIITEYKLVFVSTTEAKVIGITEYYKAMVCLSSYIIDSNEKTVLLRGLNLDEMYHCLQQSQH